MANNKLVTVDVLQYNNEKIKEQLNKKLNAQQDILDSGKLLGIDQTGMVIPVDAPDSVKVSAESDNQIEQKQDGIYVAPTDLSDYAKTDDIPTITNDLTDALKADYDDAVTKSHEHTNATTLDGITDAKVAEWDAKATETYVDDAILNAQLGGEEVDLTGFVKEEDLQATLEDYVLDDEIETITAEQIEQLIGLSADEITNLASLLSDQEISISHTWSSSKIYSELANTLDSAKAYTLQELAKSIGASYKVVTSVDQMTDSKVLYLLKDTNSGMYNIYVYDADTTTAELIGTFEVNLDDYMTRTELTDTFATKADVTANYATKTELSDYATKQEVVDGYATKEELSDLQDAVDNATVEISEETDNQIQTLEDGLYVAKVDVVISKADYDALDESTRNNGQTYFVYDDNTTEDGTDLSQFAKTSDLVNYLPRTGGEVTGSIFTKGLAPTSDSTYVLGDSNNAYLATYAQRYYIRNNGTGYGSLEVVPESEESTNGYVRLLLGNNKEIGEANSAYGYIVVYGANSGYTALKFNNNGTDNIDINFPNKAGTLALTSDLGTNVPLTEIELDTSVFTKPEEFSSIQYMIRNGICYINVMGVGLVNTGKYVIADDFCKCAVGIKGSVDGYFAGTLQNGNDANKFATIYINSGKLMINAQDSTGAFWGSFSFPVVE